MLTFRGIVLTPTFPIAMSWTPTVPWPLSTASPTPTTSRPMATLLVVVVVVVPL